MASENNATGSRPLNVQLDRIVQSIRGAGLNNIPLLILFPAIVALFALIMPGRFLNTGTLQSITFQLPELGLLSLAMVIPLISGGLNLAIIATANQAALLMVYLMSTHIGADTDPTTTWMWIGISLAAGLALCVFIGVVTGALIAVGGVHPILVTLGTMTLIGGVSIFLTRGKTFSGVPEPILLISNGTVFWIPVSFLLFVIVCVAVHILLTQMPLGIKIHMLGSNLQATRYSGVDTTRALISVYVLSSVLCWLAAIVMMARFNSAGADFAQSYLLITVLAAILGGVDPYGGFGRVSGLFLALLILQTISSGFNLLGLSPQLTLASWGGILILVIAAQRLYENWTLRKGLNPQGVFHQRLSMDPIRTADGTLRDPADKPADAAIRRVGFVGLGQMGSGMAGNLLRHGFEMLLLAHRQRAVLEELVALGASEVHSAAEMAATCDAIFLCVANAEQVQQVVEGENGVVAGARPGLIIIDCTTSSPRRLVELQSRHRDLVFVDAPLGRSPAEAREGTLSTLVGASPAVFDRIRPLLNAFADTIQLIGPLGSGQTLKLVNNFVSLGYAALYAEALALTLKSGLTVEHFYDLIQTSRMNCQFFETFMPWVLEGDASSHRFSLRNADQTIRDVEALARAYGLDSALAASVAAVYHRAISNGMADADLPELPRSTALDAGLDLRPLAGPIA